jgi:hypothetical protein
MDNSQSITESIRVANFSSFGWFVRVWRPSLLTVELYKKRCGKGKCGANGFLMNQINGRPDSVAAPEGKNDKTVLIQNLSRPPSKLSLRWKFF